VPNQHEHNLSIDVKVNFFGKYSVKSCISSQNNSIFLLKGALLMATPDKYATTFFKRCDQKINSISDELGNLLVNLFHQIALFAIGAATVWASVHAFVGMIASGESNIENLLLLFIYLEIGAMVGIYFKTNRMPVRFLIYVAITALTRLLISIANHHEKADAKYMIEISSGILILCIAAVLLRFGSTKFPTDAGLEKTDDDS